MGVWKDVIFEFVSCSLRSTHYLHRTLSEVEVMKSSSANLVRSGGGSKADHQCQSLFKVRGHLNICYQVVEEHMFSSL